MATIAIGDIHGWREPLDDLLAPDRPRPGRPTTRWCSSATTSTAAPTRRAAWMPSWRSATPCRRASYAWSATTRSGCCRRWSTVPAPLVAAGDGRLHHHPQLLAGGRAGHLRRRGRRRPRPAQRRGPLPYEPFFEAMPREHREFFASLDRYCETPGLHLYPRRRPPVDRRPRPPGQGAHLGPRRIPRGIQRRRLGDVRTPNDADIDAEGWPRPRVVGQDDRPRHHRPRRADRGSIAGPRHVQSARYEFAIRGRTR